MLVPKNSLVPRTWTVVGPTTTATQPQPLDQRPGRLRRWQTRGLLLLGLALLPLQAGCGEAGPQNLGPVLRLSGDFNSWSKGEDAPSLKWDGSHYVGVVELPGDKLQLQLYAPMLGQVLGKLVGPGRSASVPGQVALQGGGNIEPFRLSTPLPTRYQLDYEPGTGKLHIDLAEDAATGLPEPAALLVTALRGSDKLPPAQRAQRAQALRAGLRDAHTELPLQVGTADSRGVTFLYLDPVDYPELSVVGDFNRWTTGSDPMAFALDGSVAYLARRASGVRLEYRFDLHGQRFADVSNPEIAWDGAYVPPSPSNLLGGNSGELNSVAFTPGYVEPGSRLRLLQLPPADNGAVRPQVLVYLPPGYAQTASQATRYPTLYIHDGKDALVRGRYDKTLDRLANAQQLPNVIGVFVAAPADPQQRLALLTHYADPTYPEITPKGDTYAKFLLDTVLPTVEKQYRAGEPRAMLGVDLAGPFSLQLLWTDESVRFTRLASQSGRFGWGDPNLVDSPYLRLLAKKPSPRIQRLSFDWSDADHPQAQTSVHEAARAALTTANFAGKVQFAKQASPLPMPWDSLRERLDNSLVFLMGDLTPQPK